MTEIVYDENKLTKQSKIETNKQQQNKQKNTQTTKYIYIYIYRILCYFVLRPVQLPCYLDYSVSSN